MIKSFRLGMIVVLAALAAVLLCLAACDQGGTNSESGEKSEYTLEVPAAIRLKASQTSYDWLDGVTGSKDGTSIEVTADVSGVNLGVPGKYSVLYSCGDEEEMVPVFIYETPYLADAEGNAVSEAPSAVISYADARSGAVGGIYVLDTFGEKLSIHTETAVIDGFGRVEYGEQKEVSYSAADAAGNTLTFSREVTISEEGRPDYTEQIAALEKAAAFDMSSWNMSLPLPQGSALLYVLEGDGAEVQDVTPYATLRGITDSIAFNGEWFAAGGARERTLDIVTSDGWNTISFEVTDESAPLVHFDGGDPVKGIDGLIAPAEEIVLPMPFNGGYSTLPVTYNCELFTGSALNQPAKEVSGPGPYLYRVTAGSANGTTVIEQQFYATGEHDLLSEIANSGSVEYVDVDGGAYAMKILQLAPYRYTISRGFFAWAAENYAGFTLNARSDDGFMKVFGGNEEPANYPPEGSGGSVGIHYPAGTAVTFEFKDTSIPGFSNADALNVSFNGSAYKYLRGVSMLPLD